MTLPASRGAAKAGLLPSRDPGAQCQRPGGQPAPRHAAVRGAVPLEYAAARFGYGARRECW